jgi:hypothetical protein
VIGDAFLFLRKIYLPDFSAAFDLPMATEALFPSPVVIRKEILMIKRTYGF